MADNTNSMRQFCVVTDNSVIGSNEEDDTLVCGRCKSTFKNISAFVLHKSMCHIPGIKTLPHSSSQHPSTTQGCIPTMPITNAPSSDMTQRLDAGTSSSSHYDPTRCQQSESNVMPATFAEISNPALCDPSNHNSLGENLDLIVPSIDPNMTSISPSVLNMTCDNSLGSISSPDLLHPICQLSLPFSSPCSDSRDNSNINFPIQMNQTPVKNLSQSQVQIQAPASTHAQGSLTLPSIATTSAETQNMQSIPIQTTFNIPLSVLANSLGASQLLLTTNGQTNQLQLGGANIVLNISTPTLSQMPGGDMMMNNGSSVIFNHLNHVNHVNQGPSQQKHPKVKQPKKGIATKNDAGINVLRAAESKNKSASGKSSNSELLKVIKKEIVDDDPSGFQNPCISSTEPHMGHHQDACHGLDIKSPAKALTSFSGISSALGFCVTTAPASSSTKKKLKCHFCDRCFNKNFDLQQHIRCHTGEKPFQCVVCGRAFAQKSNVKKHMQTHKVWPDGLNNTLPPNSDKQNMSEHLNQGEPSTSLDSMPFVQVRARSSSPTSSVETTSMMSHSHEESHVKTAQNSYACPYCEYVGHTYFELKSHMKDHKREKVYKCIQASCGRMFPELQPYIDHIESHKNEMTYRCHQCTKTFETLQELGEHQFIHSLYPNSAPRITTKYYRCQKCLNKYTTPSALEHHQATSTHHYPCTQCNKVFPCERYLRRHLITHGTGLHVCQFCGKTFKTANYLKVHMVIHTGDKPFTCNVCNASFNRRDKLKRHKLVHDPVKRFKCPFKIHTGCTKEFNRPDKLKAHVLTHSGMKPYTCVHCARTFSRKAHLREHIKSHNSSGVKCSSLNSHVGHSSSSSSHPSQTYAHTSSENLAGNIITYFDCVTCGTLFTCREELQRHACSGIRPITSSSSLSAFHSAKSASTSSHFLHRGHKSLKRKLIRPTSTCTAKAPRPSPSKASHGVEKTPLSFLSQSMTTPSGIIAHTPTASISSTPSASSHKLTEILAASFEIDSNGSIKEMSSGQTQREADQQSESLPQVDIIRSGDPSSQGGMLCTINGVTYRITATSPTSEPLPPPVDANLIIHNALDVDKSTK